MCAGPCLCPSSTFKSSHGQQPNHSMDSNNMTTLHFTPRLLLCRLCWVQDRHACLGGLQCISWAVQHPELHSSWHGRDRHPLDLPLARRALQAFLAGQYRMHFWPVSTACIEASADVSLIACRLHVVLGQGWYAAAAAVTAVVNDCQQIFHTLACSLVQYTITAALDFRL